VYIGIDTDPSYNIGEKIAGVNVIYFFKMTLHRPEYFGS